MIKEIEIENYRSFEKVSVELKNLNVLIGPNGCGKSNFLEIFNLFNSASEGQLAEKFIDWGGYNQVVTQGESSRKVFFRFEFTSDPPFREEGIGINYKVQFAGSRESSYPIIIYENLSYPKRQDTPFFVLHRDIGKIYLHNLITGKNDFLQDLLDEYADSQGLSSEEIYSKINESELIISQVGLQNYYPTPAKLTNLMRDWKYYQPIQVDSNSPVRRSQLVRSDWALFSNGENLIPILYNIQSKFPNVWDEIIELLNTFYPDFQKITLPMEEGAAGHLYLSFWEKNSKIPYRANQLSDGTLRLLCLIAILKNPKMPPLICIDEPELSMHPDWVHLLAELLQEASERTQIIVSTHSPELVSKLKPEEVIVVEKEDGATQMKRLESEPLKIWLEKYNLGELWKSNIIGGR